jgi:hypothetical protein
MIYIYIYIYIYVCVCVCVWLKCSSISKEISELVLDLEFIDLVSWFED